MAEQFGVSRTTVLLTYERLIAEGFLETSPTKGTFVAHSAGRGKTAFRPIAVPPKRLERAPGSSDHRVGTPDPSLFPLGRWKALMRSALAQLGSEVKPDHSTDGSALRQAIAGWLATSRRVDVEPDQVVVVNGRRQALHLAAHVAAHHGACPPMRAVMEDPGDAEAAAILADTFSDLVRVPVDADGICTEMLPPRDITLLHLTPEHQIPLGATLSAGRRSEVITWAARAGALVLEEDIDGELRYGGSSAPPLISLDPDERVIMLGGFGTSLGPWLCVAYLVLPRRMMDVATETRRLLSDFRFNLEETALAKFLTDGGYARHLHGLAKTYRQRRDLAFGTMRHHCGKKCTLWGGKAGLHLTWFPARELGSPAYLAELARGCGLESAAVEGRYAPRLPAALCIGFGASSPLQLESSLSQFADRVLGSGCNGRGELRRSE